MKTILVIDDEPAIREIIRGILESAGYRVIEAANGANGLALFRQRKPCLVITDILMPGKDGMEAIRELRGMDPKVPIIVISGGSQIRDAVSLAEAQQLGAVGTLQKPFRHQDLLVAIEGALKTG
jgi:DNA-binding NtrC family response regulator